MAFPVRAQQMSNTAFIPASFPDTIAEANIVRICNDRFAVGYMQGSIDNYFYVSDVDGFDVSTSCYANGRLVKIDSNITISDMLCIDNRVYFCGRFLVMGMYGWFDIAELTDSAMVHLNYFFTPSFDKIRKMVVPGPNPTNPQIIAVAEQSNNDCILQIWHGIGCHAATLPVWGSTGVGQVDNLLIYRGRLLIVGSDKYGNISDSAFYVRRTSWSNMLCPETDTLYVYGHPALYAHPMQGTASVITDDLRLAIAHGPVAGQNMNIRVAYLNFDTDMSCNHVHATPGRRSYMFKSFELMPLTREAILSFNGYEDTGRIAFRPELSIPYGTTKYSTNLRYIYSTARFRDNSIISAWSNHWEMQRYDPMYAGPMCAPYESVAVSIPMNYIFQKIYNPVSWGSPTFYTFFSFPYTDLLKVRTRCMY